MHPAFATAATREEYDEAFAQVLSDPLEYGRCRPVWRLAASMGRNDVLLALLNQPFDMNDFRHALRWSAPQSIPILEAFQEREDLHAKTPLPDFSAVPQRL